MTPVEILALADAAIETAARLVALAQQLRADGNREATADELAAARQQMAAADARLDALVAALPAPK